MDPIWYIVIVTFVIALVGGGIAIWGQRALGGRRRTELEAEPTPTDETDDSGDVPPSVEAETEVPEAPRTRMQRLRARLAGQNNPLSRGLLALISADKLDEDTWDDFEATLSTLR